MTSALFLALSLAASPAELFKDGDYPQAALAAAELQQDLASGLDAQLVLGKSLYRLGLLHSSLAVFSKVLVNAPRTKHATKALEWMLFISRKTPNKDLVLDEIARNAGSELPERYRTEIQVLLARHHYAYGLSLDEAGHNAEGAASFAEVKRLARLIPRGDPFYASGKYLEGLTEFRDNKVPESAAALKEVLRSTDDTALRELTFMQLGRAAYGARQERHAVAWYGKVQRGGPQWLDSLFESSWASYRMGNDEQALGNLVTLSSPHFKNEYYPEAFIMRGVIYFENCRYPEARAVVDELTRVYQPVLNKLDALLKTSAEGGDFYDQLDEMGGASSSPTAVTEDVKRLIGSVKEVEAELDAISGTAPAFSQSGLAQTLAEDLKQRRLDLRKKAGTLARRSFASQSEDLKRLFVDGLRIKFDVKSLEKDLLEAKLNGKNKGAKLVDYDFPMEAGEDEEYWPLNDEYWRDELGTYLYTLTKGCAEHRTSVPVAQRASR